MTLHAIAVVELEATSASCFTRLVNIVNVFPRYLRNILFAAHALCTGDKIRFTNPSHAFPFLLCEVGLPSCTCYRFIDCKVFPSDVFTPLAASSRSRSWCNKAHIKSEGPKARQTSRKTAMYRLFSRGKSPSAPTIAYSIVRGQCALGRALPFEYRRRLSASRWCTHQAPDTNSLDNKSTGWLLPVLLHTSRCIALRCIFVHLHSKIASSWPMCALVFRTSGRLWKSIFSCLVGKYK